MRIFKSRKNHGFIEGLKFAEESTMGLEDQSKAYMSETRTEKEIQAFREGMAAYFRHVRYINEWTEGKYGNEPGDYHEEVQLSGETGKLADGHGDSVEHTYEIREQGEMGA